MEFCFRLPVCVALTTHPPPPLYNIGKQLSLFLFSFLGLLFSARAINQPLVPSPGGSCFTEVVFGRFLIACLPFNWTSSVGAAAPRGDVDDKVVGGLATPPPSRTRARVGLQQVQDAAQQEGPCIINRSDWTGYTGFTFT